MEALVSAIITTYKRTPTMLERAINSVLNQTYKNIELIVVDDSPQTYEFKEDVKKFVESLGANVRYISHKENLGACAARNTGFKNCKGEFVAFLDDDDEWFSEKIEKQLEVFKNKSDVALVYCGHKTINDSNSQITTAKTKFLSGYLYDKLIFDNYVGSTSFPLIKRDAFEKAGGFDTLMMSAQDYDLWLRIAKKYCIDFVAEPLVYYHVHNGEQISKSYKNKICGLERINEKNKEFLMQNRRAWMINNIVITQYYAAAGDWRKALKIWWKCFLKCPYALMVNAKYLIKILVNIIKH